MANRLSEQSRELLRLLADGEWHDRDIIKRKLMDLIPPGRAWRTFQHRDESREKMFGPRVRGLLDQASQIESGRVTLANAALHSMSKRYVETRGEGITEKMEIRIRPERMRELFPVLDGDGEPSDEARSDEQADSEDDEALLDAGTQAEVHRLIVREEVRAALETFGDGLADYLDRRFDALTDLIRLDNGRRRGGRQQHRQQQSRH